MTSLANMRPQPWGLYDPPLGLLLLPPPRAEPEHAALMRGEVPERLPGHWEFWGWAQQGQMDQARKLLQRVPEPWASYNRFVLQPTQSAYQRLRSRLQGPWLVLLQAAAYALAVEDQPPSPDLLSDELAAVVWMLHATAARERGDEFGALELLQRAACAAESASPVLAARLLCQLGQWLLEHPGHCPDRAAQVLRQGLQLARQAALPLLNAQLWLYLGLALHHQAQGSRSLLLEAVRCYQKALHQGITRASAPQLYALAQNHLGLAYMAMPLQEASDRLRLGIAVRAFREAVQTYDPEKTPQLWASAQMNLANALQYLPSAHPAQNLLQAVEAYEGVLRVRDKALDPVGYARALLNQANALAHLGQFSRALDKASEALVVFRRHEQNEEAQAALQLIEQIHQHRCPSTQKNQHDRSTTHPKAPQAPLSSSPAVG